MESSAFPIITFKALQTEGKHSLSFHSNSNKLPDWRSGEHLGLFLKFLYLKRDGNKALPAEAIQSDAHS